MQTLFFLETNNIFLLAQSQEVKSYNIAVFYSESTTKNLIIYTRNKTIQEAQITIQGLSKTYYYIYHGRPNDVRYPETKCPTQQSILVFHRAFLVQTKVVKSN